MPREKFLKDLSQELNKNDITNYKDIITYYKGLIAEQLEQGITIEVIIAEFDSPSDIAKNIAKINHDKNNFSYNNYINESSSPKYNEMQKLKPTKINDKYTHSIKVEEDYSLNISTKTRNVVLTSSDNDEMVVQHTRIFPLALEVYQDGNNLSVVERTKNIWMIAIFQMIFYASSFAVFFFSLRNMIDTKYIFYIVVLLLTGIVATIFSLVSYKIFYTKKEIRIEVPNNKLINNLSIHLKSGNANVVDVVANTFDTKILSGDLVCINSFAYKSDLKISSGSVTVEGPYNFDKKNAEEFDLNIKSGRASISGLLTKNLSTKIFSGSVKLNNIHTTNYELNCFSGSVQYNNFNFDNGSALVKSGSLKGEKIQFNNLDLNVKSGSIKLNEVNGKSEDFHINGKVKSGSFKVDGNNLTDSNMILVDAYPNKAIKYNVTSGSIRINFKNR